VKAAVVERPGVIVVKDVPRPKLESDYDIIVRVRKASICRHPDYELWQGLRPPAKGGWEPADYPFILGHEFSGEIVEMGSKVKEIYPELKVGDRICEWSWCEGFAEYVRIERARAFAPPNDNVYIFYPPLPYGAVNVEGLIKRLKDNRYNGFCTLEPHVRTLDKLMEYYKIEIAYLKEKLIQ